MNYIKNFIRMENKDMKKPLLSICIPTYNRANYLKKSIESIIDQEEFKNGEVEIIISDNASEDNTEEIGIKYAGQYSNINYFRNIQNIKDENFSLALSRAHGVLRRLCNDTLIFGKHSLQYMCNIVRQYKDTKPQIVWNNKDGGEGNIVETNFVDAIVDLNYWITSIATFSVWEDDCIDIEKDIAGSELSLWQVKKFLELAYKKDRILILYNNITKTQQVYKKDISYGLYQVFYLNYFKLMQPYFDKGILTNEDREYLEKVLLLEFFPDWCAKWKLKNTSMRYSQSEDLYGCIYRQYYDKAYWNDFLKKYNLLLEQQKKDKFKRYYNILNQWLFLKHENKSLENYFVKHSYKNIAIYGMGEMGIRLYDELKNTDIKVIYGIDRNAEFLHLNLNIIDVNDKFEEVDAIIITPIFAYEKIVETLQDRIKCPMISLEEVVYEV